MHVYRLRIHPERAPDVWRVLEFSARHTLHDVHAAIQDAFELDDDHLYAFYLSGKHWDRASIVECEDADGVRLFQLGFEPGRRFSYVFDFGDELWHELEVVALSESASAPEEPLLVEAVGSAPPQYEGLEDEELPRPDVAELLPLASELVGVLVSDPGRTSEERRESLRSAHRVARELAARLEGRAERFWALEADERHVLGVLLDLPLALAGDGMVAEGGELALALSFIDPAHFLSDRAILLAEAGQREAALSQVKENLKSLGDEPWVQIKAGEVYALLGEATEAEACFRATLEHAQTEDVRTEVCVRLSALLRAQQREAEAAALEAAEQARTQRSLAERAGRTQAPRTARWVAPQVGRNDPCPCGSGKKYKKCCGA